jgi:hypothetical protein
MPAESPLHARGVVPHAVGVCRCDLAGSQLMRSKRSLACTHCQSMPNDALHFTSHTKRSCALKHPSSQQTKQRCIQKESVHATQSHIPIISSLHGTYAAPQAGTPLTATGPCSSSHLGQYVVACSYSLRAALGSRKSCHVIAAHAYQMCGLPGAHAVPRWKQRAAAARLPRRRSSTAHCGNN